MRSVAVLGLPDQNVSLSIQVVITHFACVRLESRQVDS